MVKIYTSKKYFRPEEILIDNESFFDNTVTAKSFDELSLDVIMNIDKAKLIDRNIGTIETPFGITSIDNVSTGCKAVLNYIYISNNKISYRDIKAIDATECGWNAIEELFKAIERKKYELGVIIEHDNKLFHCSDRDYLVDNKRQIHSLLDF